MKVMVAGATGFIGKQLVKKLNKKGHEIVVLTRNPNTSRFHIPAHCNTIFWNPEKYSLPPTTLKGVDAVINLAGEGIADGRWSAKRKQALIQSRILSTRRLVNAMSYMRNKPKVFISSSAIGFYGSREDELLDESSNKGHGFLSEICQHWEDECLRANDLGIRTIAFRIGMVLGHDGGALDKMLPPFKCGVGGNLGNGSQWMSWIHIADLVNMIIYALENPNVKGIYNAVSPNPVINKKFTKIFGKALNRPTLFTVPKTLHGIPVRWQSKITDWKPNKKFSDIQLKGPYKHWHHTHEFEEKMVGP